MHLPPPRRPRCPPLTRCTSSNALQWSPLRPQGQRLPLKPSRRLSFSASALIDCALITLSMGIGYLIRFAVLAHGEPLTTMTNHMAIAAAFSPFYVFLYSLLGVYAPRSVHSTVRTLGLVMVSNTLAVMLLTDVVFFFRLIDFSRWLIVLFWVITNVLVGTKAALLDHLQGQMQLRGEAQRAVLLVGSGPVATSYLESVQTEEPPASHVVGTVGEAPLSPGVPLLGAYADISDIISATQVEQVVIALESHEYHNLESVLPDCSASGVKVMLLPPYHQYLSGATKFVSDANLPLICVNYIQLDNVAYAFLKRSIDIVGSLALIILSSPIMLVAAIGTKLSSPGPVIFTQTRIGRGMRPFEMYKFRSMRVNAESNTAWSVRDDPRRTRFGSFIRHYSIDELPQFFNVLKGDMSLVGPRPEIPKYVDEFRESIPLYMVRHLVRPGITGWAQINGLRGDTSIKRRIKHDLYYIEHWSLFFDLRILLETPFKGIVATEETLQK